MTRRLAPLLLAVSLTSLGVARGDVIHLTTGRSITGTVERESADEVVVRTPNGRLTLPRHLVERIERQERGQTLIGLARERARAGDHEEAERLFRRAAEDPDPEVAAAAREALEDYRARRERSDRFRPDPGTPMDLPEGAEEAEVVEGESPQDQLDRARAALQGNRPDPQRARRLLMPLLESSPDDVGLQYLLGRANELAGLDREAQRLYLQVLDGRAHTASRPTVWLGELARRVAAGVPVLPHSPGVSQDWRRIETEHFAIYHAFREAPGWIGSEAEDALEDAMERLEVLVREVDFQGRVQVFLFPTAAVYQSYQGIPNAGGHARRRAAPDGWLYEIHAYPDRSFYRYTFRHEVAHALLYQVAGDMPAWAHEGAATMAEPERERFRYRRVTAGRLADGSAVPLLEFLDGEAERGQTRESWLAYYAQASTTFEALTVLREGPRRAMRAASVLRSSGAREGLRRLNLPESTLQAEIERIANQ